MSRSWMTIELALRPTPQTRERLWDPSAARLSLVEREEIRAGIVAGETYGVSPGGFVRSVLTISREVAKNGGRAHYRAYRRTDGLPAVPAGRRSPSSPADRSWPSTVQDWLEEPWSPEQIAHRLRLEHADDPMMWVSHETIYQSLFVQGRGALKRELVTCLRTGRAERRPRGRSSTQRRGQIPGKVMISERPAEVADRAVPGHWEGDLIVGKGHRSAIGTLVERTSRYVLLLHLPEGASAEAVRRRHGRGHRTPAAPSSPARSPGIRGPRRASTLTSRSPPASRSTSATRTHPGSSRPTRTPTASCDSSSPRAPTSASTAARPSSMPSASSTVDPESPSTGASRVRNSRS